VSPEVREYLFGVETGNTEYTQTSVDGFVTGEAWELPAGPLSIAAGFHYREDEIDDLPGEITLAGNTWGSSAAGNTKGDDKTKALFVEFDAPLIADKPGFQNVTLNASARYTDVDSYGDDTTWKLGLNWQITDSVRLRAFPVAAYRSLQGLGRGTYSRHYYADGRRQLRGGPVGDRRSGWRICARLRWWIDLGNVNRNRWFRYPGS
jgi:iron complex outermembrane receptor protein